MHIMILFIKLIKDKEFHNLSNYKRPLFSGSPDFGQIYIILSFMEVSQDYAGQHVSWFHLSTFIGFPLKPLLIAVKHCGNSGKEQFDGINWYMSS